MVIVCVGRCMRARERERERVRERERETGGKQVLPRRITSHHIRPDLIASETDVSYVNNADEDA